MPLVQTESYVCDKNVDLNEDKQGEDCRRVLKAKGSVAITMIVAADGETVVRKDYQFHSQACARYWLKRVSLAAFGVGEVEEEAHKEALSEALTG